MRIATAMLLAVTCCLVSAALAQDDEELGLHPKPELVSPSWSFDLDVRQPRTISARDYSGQRTWYWYLPYRVTNYTGEDRLFTPQITVTNDKGEIFETGKGIPPTVYAAIREKLRNPLLETPEQVVGRVLQGEDFARDSIAVWPVSGKDIDQFTVFFTGADGETQELVSPVTGDVLMQPEVDPVTGEAVVDRDGKPVMTPVLVRRTRVYTFATPGTHNSPQFERPELIDESVVMR